MSAPLDTILAQLLTDQPVDERWNGWGTLSAVETFLLLSKALHQLENTPATTTTLGETLLPAFIVAFEQSPYQGVMENLTPRIVAAYERDSSDHGRQLLNRLLNGFAWSLT